MMLHVHRSVGHLQDLAACALCNPVSFLSQRRFTLYGAEIFCWYKWSLATIYGEQIRHHLSSHRNGCAIRVSFLLGLLVHQGEFVTLLWCQLGGFHQNTLNMLVALLESGVRNTLSAELFSPPHNPQ
jgi:hypothetical protein